MLIQFLEPVEIYPLAMSGQLGLPNSSYAEPGDVAIVIENDVHDLMFMLGNEMFCVPHRANRERWVIFDD